MRCPNCNEDKGVKKNGFYKEKRRWKCLECHTSFYTGTRPKPCECGLPLNAEGQCSECGTPFVQYHKADQAEGVYL